MLWVHKKKTVKRVHTQNAKTCGLLTQENWHSFDFCLHITRLLNIKYKPNVTTCKRKRMNNGKITVLNETRVVPSNRNLILAIFSAMRRL